MSLTTFLDGYLLEPYLQHPLLPAQRRFPCAHQERQKGACRACRQGGRSPDDAKAGHVSYARGWATEALESRFRINLAHLREFQYLTSRLHADAAWMYGAAGGYLVNSADTGLNTYGAVGWIVDSVSEDGCSITVHLPGHADPGAASVFSWRVPNHSGMGYSSFNEQGAVQPNDLMTIGYPSVLAGKHIRRIRKVTLDRTAMTATWELDGSVSEILTDSRIDQSVPMEIPLTTWRYAAPEKFSPVIEPSTMRCARTRRTWGSLPADKRVVLTRPDGSEGRIAFPTLETFRVEYRVAGVWIDVSSSSLTRAQFEKTEAGWKVWLCLGTVDWAGNATLSDLVPADAAVRVMWWFELAASDTRSNYCRPKCGGQCKWAFKEPSKSFFDMDDGEAVSASGETWHCLARRTYELVEDGPGWRKKWYKPSTVEHFAPECSLHGSCNFFEPLGYATDRYQAWSVQNCASPFWHELWMSVPYRQEQGWPGYNSYLFWKDRCIGNPSFQSLYGGLDLTNPSGYHQTMIPKGWGMGFVGDMATTTTDGHTRLTPLWGGIYDGRESWDTLVFPAAPGAGVIPRLTGWTDKLSPFLVTYDGTSDPTESIRRYEDRAGYRIKLDECTEQGRGLARYSYVVPSPETLVVENVSTVLMDELQSRSDSTYIRYAEARSGPGGFQYDGEIQILPLIATGKTWKEVVRGVVHSITGANGRARIEIEHQTQYWSEVKSAGGESWDEIHEYEAGGMFVQLADPYKPRSVYHPDSSVGNVTDKASIGDSVRFDRAIPGDPEFGDRVFALLNAQACVGSPAENWGAGNPEPSGFARAPGFLAYGKQRDVVEVADEHGWLVANAAALVGATIICERGRNVLDPTSELLLSWAKFGAEVFTAAAASDYLVLYGEGRVLTAPALTAVVAVHPRVCWLCAA